MYNALLTSEVNDYLKVITLHRQRFHCVHFNLYMLYIASPCLLMHNVVMICMLKVYKLCKVAP